VRVRGGPLGRAVAAARADRERGVYRGELVGGEDLGAFQGLAVDEARAVLQRTLAALLEGN
jgi:hypothetical protein